MTLIPPTTQAEITVNSNPIAICDEATEYLDPQIPTQTRK